MEGKPTSEFPVVDDTRSKFTFFHSIIMSKIGKTLRKRLVKSPWLEENLKKVAEFSPADQTHVALATARATFLPCELDFESLEKCLELVLEDIPILGGR